MLAAFESFVGVLFAGFALAIIFGKFSRIQSIARIVWSDVIVIQYGPGIQESHCTIANKTTSSSSSSSSSSLPTTGRLSSLKEIPCPILEFRIVNVLYQQLGGEIINATLNIVATTVAETQSEPSSVISSFHKSTMLRLSGAERAEERTTSVKRRSRSRSEISRSAFQNNSRLTPRSSPVAFQRFLERSSGLRRPRSNSDSQSDDDEKERYEKSSVSSSIDISAMKASASVFTKSSHHNKTNLEPTTLRKSIRVQEDPTGALVPHLVFSKLESATNSHPCFKHVWTVRHALDETSPLLSSFAKRRIIQNHGHWPEEWNDHRHVRQHFHFHQLIITFTGKSRVSGSPVFAHKVYDFSDVTIGYQFADMIRRRREDEQIALDMALVNDVEEQNGGGGEPFTDLDNEHDGFLQSAMQAGTSAIHRSVEAAKATFHAIEGAGQVCLEKVKVLRSTKLLQRSSGSRNLFVDGSDSMEVSEGYPDGPSFHQQEDAV